MFIDLPVHLLRNRSNKKYTKEQVEFAINLRFYSRQAYDYVKTKFNLPSHSTVTRLENMP